jgi:hypothetical protein
VREPEPAGALRYLADHPRRGSLVHHLLELLVGQTADVLQRRDVELPAEHRREAEGARALLRESIDAQPDDFADALWNRPLPICGIRVIESPFSRSEAHDLAEKEWVAFRLSVDGGNDVSRWAQAGDRLDVMSDVRWF